MIKLLKHGDYKLIETPGLTKILYLSENGTFAWINAEGIGEILVSSHKNHRMDYILSQGKYRVYSVKDEPKLTDTFHLELLVGKGFWQGYLLLTDFPKGVKKRSRIIPTKEVISKSTSINLEEREFFFKHT